LEVEIEIENEIDYGVKRALRVNFVSGLMRYIVMSK
jgi:hypothetical protein